MPLKAKTILTAVIILLFCSGCRSSENQNIPDDLLGVWVTSEEKYKDRFMEFKKDALIFGTGDENQSMQLLGKVKVVRQDDKDLYTVHYVDPDGEENPFSFFYNSSLGVITLKNQKTIEWKKDRK